MQILINGEADIISNKSDVVVQVGRKRCHELGQVQEYRIDIGIEKVVTDECEFLISGQLFVFF